MDIISIIRSVPEAVVTGISVAQSLLTTAFHVSAYVGHIIVATISMAFYCGHTLYTSVAALVSIFYRDTLAFVEDVGYGAQNLFMEGENFLCAIGRVLGAVMEAVWQIISSVLLGWEISVSLVYSMFSRLGFLANCVKDFLTLGGSGMYMFIRDLPVLAAHGVVGFLGGICRLVCYILLTIVDVPVSIMMLLQFLMQILVQFFIDIPVRAYVGLGIAAALSFVLARTVLYCTVTARHVPWIRIVRYIVMSVLDLTHVPFKYLWKCVRNCFQKKEVIIDGKPQVSEDVTCVICLENTRDTILLPCRHFCVCYECYRKLGYRKSCPVCRRNVRSSMKVYM